MTNPTNELRERFPCRWCKGHGVIRDAVSTGGGYFDDADCELCEGTGLGYRAYAEWLEKRLEVTREKVERLEGESIVTRFKRQFQFSLNTFGPGPKIQGVLDHIRKEIAEIEAEPHDIEEWIDVAMLALDGAWRCGCHSAEEVAAALLKKQIKNEGRSWPDWRTADRTKAIEHDRALQPDEETLGDMIKDKTAELEGIIGHDPWGTRQPDEETTMTDKAELIDQMVDRFLSWELPKDFAPDGGIEFTPPNNPAFFWPTGTNLLTADQARVMIEHLLSDEEKT